jgi:hypothetical protein
VTAGQFRSAGDQGQGQQQEEEPAGPAANPGGVPRDDLDARVDDLGQQVRDHLAKWRRR